MSATVSETLVHADLTREEWRLVSTLRDLPAGPLQKLVGTLLGELVRFVAEPKCTETQADGVPCESVSAECDQCQRVLSVLEALTQRLQKT